MIESLYFVGSLFLKQLEKMPQIYRADTIAEIVSGSLIRHEHKFALAYLLYDTRKILFPKESIFFAIKTKKNDGHKFIKQAYHAGVRVFVVENEFDNSIVLQDVSIIEVDSVLDALQELVAYHRELYNLPIVGITGSNGKTIVKEWLYQLLSPEFMITKSPKSYNSQIGVPVSVWQLNDETQMGIFEAGISKKGEMGKLEPMIRPSIGIFTNIGAAHSAGFNSIEEKIQEKLLLFHGVERLYYSPDYPTISEAIKVFANTHPDIEYKTWSFDSRQTVNLSIYKTEANRSKTILFARYKKQEIQLEVGFRDKASLENIAICWLYLLEMGYEASAIKQRFGLLSPLNMRIEQKSGINNTTIINDSYSLDLSSLAITLDLLSQQKKYPKRTLIISDILQTGKLDEEIYKELATLISQHPIDRLICIGKKISKHKNLFKKIEVQTHPSTNDFLKKTRMLNFDSESILLKGARKFEFEKIDRFLSDKLHDTVLEINLDALVHNFNFFKNQLMPHVQLMVMVKAFSYGYGSYELANLLQYHKADYLAVAYSDEGVRLRKAGIEAPIVVLNPERGSFNNIVEYKLEPVVYSFRVLKLFKQFINQLEKPVKLPIHIEINTGMNRLGFEPNLAYELGLRLKRNEQFFEVKSIFTHLASSQSLKFQDFTHLQIQDFESTYNILASAIDYSPTKHALNTAGILNYPKFHFDMVRLGIGLYGIDSSGQFQNKLQNVSTFKTVISQIRYVKKGETIGYNQMGVAHQDIKIATVAIGYADGVNRIFGNGKAQFLVNEKLAPTIGDICMDMCMIDVTDIDVQEGNEVVIFGDELPITQVCKQIGMIPYELLTSISERVKRVYLKE